MASQGHFACVAKAVPKKEIAGNDRAEKAMNDEWGRLIGKGVWSYDQVREWSEIAASARRDGKTVHLGRIFGLIVLKGSELPETRFKMSVSDTVQLKLMIFSRESDSTITNVRSFVRSSVRQSQNPSTA